MKRTFKLTQFKTFFKVRYFFFYKCVDNIDIKAFLKTIVRGLIELHVLLL